MSEALHVPERSDVMWIHSGTRMFEAGIAADNCIHGDIGSVSQYQFI